MSKYQRYISVLRLTSALLVGGMAISSCSSAKLLSKDEHLLHKVDVVCDKEDVNVSALEGYVRQNPNARWFNVAKVPLGIYSLAGKRDNWLNRAIKRMGEAPVVYDRVQAERSSAEMKQALQNMGYLGAQVALDEEYKRHKVSLAFRLSPGYAYKVDSLKWNVADTTIARLMNNVQAQSLLRPSMTLNINVLDDERKRITDYLKNLGYYKFSKDYITYTADTIQGTKEVQLTVHVAPFKETTNAEPTAHPSYSIGDLKVVTEFDMANISGNRLQEFSHTEYNGLDIFYRNSLFMRPSVFAENVFIRKGGLYNASEVQRTYSSLGMLGALKYSNIHFIEREDTSANILDAYVLMAPSRVQGFSTEVEGTNTAGDLGAAVSFTYQHKNIFKGSETFTIKLRGAYEAISGLQGYSTDDYTEFGAESSINFPRFMFPFLSSDFKRRIRSSSEVGIQYNAQERPEFSRRVLSASWRYRWNRYQQRVQHRLDFMDINYVYMPSISDTFKKEYLDNVASNSILKYNYEDLFIARMGWNYSYASSTNTGTSTAQRSNYLIRFNVESGGLLLSAISRTIYDKRTNDGQYAIGNIAYAQYAKGDFDYTHHFIIDRRNSISFHFGLGIAYPYGNSKILPFEKRYFSGGANSVRGWSVRSLGPGRFSGGDKKIDFINQSGDMKLDVNLEYRTKLVGALNGAFFVDAGNIWTLREYDEQPGGTFYFDSFLQQIAVSYGFGLRLNLDYFVLRFDGGIKAINPAYSPSSRDYIPLLHPNFGRDFTFHFAVGYPF